MAPREPSRSSGWSLAARLPALAVALTLGLGALVEYASWKRQRAKHLELLESAGITARAPDVARDVGREADRRRAALRAARGLLADELDRGWQTDLSAAELERAQRQGLEKLAAARAIATAALARRPASWQAAEVLGATRYLETLRRREPMTAERRDAWRQPLLAARRLGPGQAEPVRFLAAATLSEWSRLTPAERDDAVELLGRAFADPDTFDLLATSWLRLSPSRRLAFSVVPAQPRAWGTVKSFYAGRGDWGSFARAHERQRDALFDQLSERLARADDRLAGGDRRRARWYALEVLEEAPPSRRFAPLMARALEILPPGPLGEIGAGRMAEWLVWSRELCLLGDCPLEPSHLSRMAGLARPAQPAELAAAAEMGGDWRAGELQARDRDILSARWGPYHLLRARRLAAAGDPDGHRRSLERVHPVWRRRAAFHETAALAPPRHRGSGRPGRPAARVWPAAEWRDGAGLPTLELYAAAACSGVEIDILGVPAHGWAIELRWDGDIVGARGVAPDQPVRLEVTLLPEEPHRLTIDPFLHPTMRPGSVRLFGCPA